MGYYGGHGRRARSRPSPSAQTLPQVQPAPLSDPPTGLVDCGNWAVTAVVGGARRRRPPASTSPSSSATTPAGPATSSSSSATTTSHSDLLFQTSDTTWQAYNNYGGNSLYAGTPTVGAGAVQGQLQPPVQHRATAAASARLLPLQRRVPDGPLPRGATATTSATSPASTPTAAAPRSSNTRRSCPSGTTSTGRAGQRANVEAARDAGRQPRVLQRQRGVLEDPLGEQHRRLGTRRTARWSATRKRTRREDRPVARSGPAPGATRRFSPPADGGRPENALTGTIFTVDRGADDVGTPITVGRVRQPAVLAQHQRRHASRPGQTATLGDSRRSATSGTRTSTTASARPA